MTAGGDDKRGSEASAGGYKTPPRSTRFRPGQSGNPRGRPKDRHCEAPYEAVLGRVVTVRDAGDERRTIAAEAFLLHLAKRGLEGDSSSTQAANQAIEDLRARNIVGAPEDITVAWRIVAPGSVNPALMPLRMAKVFGPYSDNARTLLEPWLVQAALAKFGDRRLSPQEKLAVVKATRTPHKVNWPDWWTEGG